MHVNFLKCGLLLVLSQLLVACGAERDTPFNPDNNNNSSSAASLGASINVKEIYRYDETHPEQPIFLETTNKQIYIVNTEEEFEDYWNVYKNDTVMPTDLDFEKIQVVILDLGNIGNCPQTTNYRNVKAYEYSNNTTLVSFNFREAASNTSSFSSSSSSSSNCSDPDELAKKRPFYFYSIESRKKILIEENVTYE